MLYVLSAYSLTALCIKLPSAVQKEKAWLKNHTKVVRLLNNKELVDEVSATIILQSYMESRRN